MQVNTQQTTFHVGFIQLNVFTHTKGACKAFTTQAFINICFIIAFSLLFCTFYFQQTFVQADLNVILIPTRNCKLNTESVIAYSNNIETWVATIKSGGKNACVIDKSVKT